MLHEAIRIVENDPRAGKFILETIFKNQPLLKHIIPAYEIPENFDLDIAERRILEELFGEGTVVAAFRSGASGNVKFAVNPLIAYRNGLRVMYRDVLYRPRDQSFVYYKGPRSVKRSFEFTRQELQAEGNSKVFPYATVTGFDKKSELPFIAVVKYQCI